jgi:hypothetical protein
VFVSLSCMSWALWMLRMFLGKFMFCCSVLANVFALRCSLILFFVSILVGLFLSNVGVELVVVDLVLCTLGVDMFVIGLSIVAVMIGVDIVRWGELFTLGLGAVMFNSDSCGGFAAGSKVTHLGSGAGFSLCVGAVTGVLFKMSSSLLKCFDLN